MKPNILLLVLMLGLVAPVAVYAQQTTKPVKVEVVPLNKREEPRRMYLYELEDSVILLDNVLLTNPSTDQLTRIPIENIKAIKYWNGKAVSIGAGTGAAVGFIIGLAIASKSDRGDSGGGSGGVNDIGMSFPDFSGLAPFASAFGGSLVGCVIGLGTASIKIPINGNISQYRSKKARLEKFLVK
ncbi:MAG: hypothetical protein JNK77_07205 [Saprospiraceae bacterium]|nr:hypothetical protein [Saprospiraceae bacterium]